VTTSGTTDFTVDVITALEEAFERAGRTFRTGYDYESAVRSMNLMFNEWSNRGINLWTVEQISVTTIIGTGSYILPADTVDAISVVLNTDDNDYRIERMAFDEYANITKKTQQSRPNQYLIERLVAQPVMRLWPVPDKVYTIKIWRLRRMQDAGSAANTLDAPFRFNDALIAGVALRVGEKNPNLDANRLQLLEKRYSEAMALAQGEDRDRSSFYLRPSLARR
jgi:hypothetical protein